MCMKCILNEFIINVITSIFDLWFDRWNVRSILWSCNTEKMKNIVQKLSYEWNVWIKVWKVLDEHFSNSPTQLYVGV